MVEYFFLINLLYDLFIHAKIIIMKKLHLFFILLLVAVSASAQEFEVPKYKFKKKKDFAKYNEIIIQCIDFLIYTPLNENESLRQEAGKFFIEWALGTPDIAIMIDYDKVEFLGEEPQYLISYMAGYSKYVLQTKDKVQLNGMVAGIESTIAFYLNNKATFSKSETIEKYIKLQQENKLKEYVAAKSG